LVKRTTDGGKTWSKSQTVSSHDARTRAAIVRLSGGRLILPYYKTKGYQALAGVSDDNGKTWTTVSVPNTADFVGDEWHLAEMPDGRLVGILRNQTQDADNRGWLYVTKSSDRGTTWSTPVRTNLRDRRGKSPAQILL